MEAPAIGMPAVLDASATERDIHELEVWAAWFEIKLKEAALDGVNIEICEVVSQHTQCIIKNCKEVQYVWDSCSAQGQCLREALTRLLRELGHNFVLSEFEHLQLEMVKLAQVLMQQEMLRQYRQIQREREKKVREEGVSSRSLCSTGLGLPLAAGDALWYLSPCSSVWRAAVVLSRHWSGSVKVDVEPARWLAPEEQAVLLRPRGSFEKEPSKPTPCEFADARRCCCNSGGSHSFIKVAVPCPLGEKGPCLGLQMNGEQNLTVSHVRDPKAEALGWNVGDQLLAVGGKPVSTRQDLEAALEQAKRKGWGAGAAAQNLEFLVSHDFGKSRNLVRSRASSRASSVPSGNNSENISYTYSDSNTSGVAALSPAAALSPGIENASWQCCSPSPAIRHRPLLPPCGSRTDTPAGGRRRVLGSANAAAKAAELWCCGAPQAI
mmetsp:Transcript_45091/g.104286  ORF Transcript_45091/g.104286 Transcript_45091/m.104286 type:complete len:437 (-) Transcript_45091:103-1413(-)